MRFMLSDSLLDKEKHAQKLRVKATVTGHFVPSSFRTILVISYPLFGNFVPSNNHFVPRSFRTHCGHFVPSSTGYIYEMPLESQFVPR